MSGQSERLPSEHPHPRGTRTSRRAGPGGRPWRAARGAALLGLLLAGCTSVADPVTSPEAKLKKALNPLGTRAEQEAFKTKVQKDPFPSAAALGTKAPGMSGT